MKTLWDKGGSIDASLIAFTTSDDWMLDKHLAFYDCISSIAHARMLASIGIISHDEANALARELGRLAKSAWTGEFDMTPEHEDCHTAIELHLTTKLGQLGKKIHTARSRNDQVQTALRLYAKEELRQIVLECHSLSSTLLALAERYSDAPMVGRTHMQKAMPSSFALWSTAFVESLIDDIKQLQSSYELIDQCPLGSAASYGVGLPIDRALTAQLLGFAKVQNNVLYAANSRGKFEVAVLHALNQVMLDLSKIASDLIFFSLPEIGYVRIPSTFCTGSSLMPQKRNPCTLELVRAKSAKVAAALMQTIEIIRTLPSGYNRDFQETKAPLIHSFETTKTSLSVMTRLLGGIELNKDAFIKAFEPEVFATDHALHLVAQGVAFRDAYVATGTNLQSLECEDPLANILSKTHQGAPGNLGASQLHEMLLALSNWINYEQQTWANVLPIEVTGKHL